MTTAKDILKAARRRQSTYRLCLRGDLLAEHEMLEADLERLARDTGLTAPSLADESPIAALAAQIRALQDEMREQTVTLRFEAMRRRDWDALLERHPKVDGEDGTYDVAGLAPELVAACLIDPVLTPAEFDDLWDDTLNASQRDEIFGAAWAANTEASNVPFSERASVVTRWREQNSKLPEPGASPEASS